MSEAKKKIHRYIRGFDGQMTRDPFGPWVLVGDAADREKELTQKLVAERLRADTAEADRDCYRQGAKIEADSADEARSLLKSAEQRNSGLIALLQRVVDSSVLSFEADAPEDLESLEADICAALKPTESGASE